MSPEELYQRAGDVLVCCNPEGVTLEDAASFIEKGRLQIRSISAWLPPVYGTTGYADGTVIDLLRQLKFQSEQVTKNFPLGIEALSVALENFRRCLLTNYPINSERLPDAGNW